MPELDVNEDEGVYYGGGYWNDLECGAAHVQPEDLRRSAGALVPRLLRERRGEPFKRALILNCGNGWVEREMVSANLFA